MYCTGHSQAVSVDGLRHATNTTRAHLVGFWSTNLESYPHRSNTCSLENAPCRNPCTEIVGVLHRVLDHSSGNCRDWAESTASTKPSPSHSLQSSPASPRQSGQVFVPPSDGSSTQPLVPHVSHSSIIRRPVPSQGRHSVQPSSLMSAPRLGSFQVPRLSPVNSLPDNLPIHSPSDRIGGVFVLPDNLGSGRVVRSLLHHCPNWAELGCASRSLLVATPAPSAVSRLTGTRSAELCRDLPGKNQNFAASIMFLCLSGGALFFFPLRIILHVLIAGVPQFCGLERVKQC